MTVMQSAEASMATDNVSSIAPDMIRWTVREFCEREGIADNANQLAEITELPYETCRTIWNDSAQRMDKGTLARLCAVLRARPGQLIDWVPGPEDDPPSKKGKRKG
jgi:DNA-binding Xre family transcriptional regulator